MKPPLPDPCYTVERHGDELTVDLSALKVLDEPAVQEIREPLLTLARNTGSAQMSLNLKGVEYITSSMLETLIQMHRLLKENGSKLSLLHLQPQVAEVFEVTKLSDLFQVQKESGN
jgi:anti-anti-sigma factor